MERQNTSIGPGDLIDGKYQVKELIHKGGMGEVWAASDLRSMRTVAVKILLPEHTEDEQLKIRFQREAKFTEPLDHDNICDICDSGTCENGFAYLVMERYTGSSLAHIFKEEALSLNRLVNVARQTLSALHEAHKNGIVHRDLKPENIFITQRDRDTELVKLLDFGLSKALGSKSTIPLTAPGQALGTPAYMSPEQVLDAGRVDGRTDLYAVGVILYEGLTKVLPFGGPTPRDTLIQIAERAPIPPREINSTIPRSLERVVLTAMAKNPDRRYRSAQEMQNALSAALSDPDSALYEPPVRYSLADEFVKPSSPDRVSRPQGRAEPIPGLVPAIVVILIILAIVLVYLFYG